MQKDGFCLLAKIQVITNCSELQLSFPRKQYRFHPCTPPLPNHLRMAVLRSKHANGHAFPGCNPYCCTAYHFAFFVIPGGLVIYCKTNRSSWLRFRLFRRDKLTNRNNLISFCPGANQTGTRRNFYFNFKSHFQNGKSSFGVGGGGVGAAPCCPPFCPSFFGVNISISYP